MCRNDWLVYKQPTQIIRSVLVGVKSGFTMWTKKHITETETVVEAVGANCGCLVGIEVFNNLPTHSGFVINHSLQLPERPITEPSVSFLALPILACGSFPDVCQIFQSKTISTFDNLFAYTMVDVTHKTLPSVTHSFELMLGRFSAFALELPPQPSVLIEFSPVCFENLTIRSNSQIPYSDIDTNNGLCRVTIADGDIFRECDVKEISAFPIADKFSDLKFPIRILSVIFGNIQRYVNTLFVSGNPDGTPLKRCKSPIKNKITFFHNWLNFIKLNSAFIGLKRLCNSIYGKLRFKIKQFSYVLVDYVMQCKLALWRMFKTFVKSKLDSIRIGFRNMFQLRNFRNLDFYRNTTHCSDWKALLIFKHFGGAALPKPPLLKKPSFHPLQRKKCYVLGFRRAGGAWQFLSAPSDGVSLPQLR